MSSGNLLANFSAHDTPERRKQYAEAQPFSHGVVTPLANPDFLKGCRQELELVGFTPKETDLYKLNQSRDLANFTAEDAKKLPHLMKLREELYSEEFRAKVSEFTGCGPLSNKVDLAGAVYNSGSHLLVHDDVVSTRRIAFIIYLTREEDKWATEDGGCLELYPHTVVDGMAVPQCTPSVRVQPLFNHFAFFTVAAGRSFHAVQEVYSPEKDRISMQGWFHTADLTLLKTSEPTVKELRALASNETFVPFSLTVPSVTMPKKVLKKKATGGAPQPPALPQVDITDATLNELRDLGVHPMYLDRDNLGIMVMAMKKEGIVRMAQFLVPDLIVPLNKAIRQIDEADGVGLGQPMPPRDDAGVTDRWARVGPPHVRRYLQLQDADAVLPEKKHRTDDDPVADEREDLAHMLECVRDNLVESNVFASYVGAIAAAAAGSQLGDRATAVRRYRPGLDFSLASVPAETPLLDVRLTFCCDPVPDEDEEGEEAENGEGEAKEEGDEEGEEEEEGAEEGDEEEEEENADLWDSCEAGGFDSYIKVTEDHTAGAVAALDSDSVLNLPCQNNTLSIALRRTDMMHFVKYVQSIAPSSRYEVSCVFKVPPKEVSATPNE